MSHHRTKRPRAESDHLGRELDALSLDELRFDPQRPFLSIDTTSGWDLDSSDAESDEENRDTLQTVADLQQNLPAASDSPQVPPLKAKQQILMEEKFHFATYDHTSNATSTRNAKGILERSLASGWFQPNEVRAPPLDKSSFSGVPVPPQRKLDARYAEALRQVLKEIIIDWTPSNDTTGVDLSLINSYIFYHQRFLPVLQRLHARATNQCTKDTTVDPQKGLDWGALLNEAPERIPEIFNKFDSFIIGVQDIQSNPFDEEGNNRDYYDIVQLTKAFEDALEYARDHRKQRKLYTQLGKTAFKNAIWIPCTEASEDEVKTLQGKFVIESEDIKNAAIEADALSDKQILVLDNKWQKILAPPRDVGIVAVILYDANYRLKGDMVSKDDIVGACIYNSDDQLGGIGEGIQQAMEDQAHGVDAFVQLKIALQRGIEDRGSMVKSGTAGLHSTNGILHPASLPRAVPPKSKNPKPATLAKLAEQNQLRFRLLHGQSDIIQRYSFALLQGFLPHVADKMLRHATAQRLLTVLGDPSTAAFASFAYSAALHVDKDDSVSIGWVSRRSQEEVCRSATL
ncbi:hypothetical protein C8Q80DRAFT_1274790 [Daedaleopsis nitida]|nr:hypothetical protein C8Q80DRAFT_1274790 [Daedaleopsis nitida]